MLCFVMASKVDFLKTGLPHFCEEAKSRLLVVKTNYSSPQIYNYCRSCWITILVLPTHVFGEAIIETLKIHNLFIQYPNNTYFSVLESS
jgi:hypothetical protein